MDFPLPCSVGFFLGGCFLRRDDTEVDGRLLFGDLLAAGFITPTLVIEVFFKTQALRCLEKKPWFFEDCGRLYTTLIIIHLGTRSTILVLFGGFLKMRDPSFSLTLVMFAGGTH